MFFAVLLCASDDDVDSIMYMHDIHRILIPVLYALALLLKRRGNFQSSIVRERSESSSGSTIDGKSIDFVCSHTTALNFIVAVAQNRESCSFSFHFFPTFPFFTPCALRCAVVASLLVVDWDDGAERELGGGNKM